MTSVPFFRSLHSLRYILNLCWRFAAAWHFSSVRTRTASKRSPETSWRANRTVVFPLTDERRLTTQILLALFFLKANTKRRRCCERREPAGPVLRPTVSRIGLLVGDAGVGRVGHLFEELVIFQHALRTYRRQHEAPGSIACSALVFILTVRFWIPSEKAPICLTVPSESSICRQTR